jgi:hypothetical protein
MCPQPTAEYKSDFLAARPLVRTRPYCCGESMYGTKAMERRCFASSVLRVQSGRPQCRAVCKQRIYLLGNSESICSQTMPKAIRPAIPRIVATLGSRPIATKNHAGRKKLKNMNPSGKTASHCSPVPSPDGARSNRLFRRLFLEKLIVAHKAGHLKFFGDHAARRCEGVRGVSGTATPSRMGRLCQAPVRRATGRAWPTARRSWHSQPTSSSAASSSTSCRTASTTSATTACWPAAPAPTTSPTRVSCSPFQTPRPSPPVPPSIPASRLVHAAAVA